MLQKINLSFWSLLLSLSLGIYIHFFVPPEYQEQKTSMQVIINDSGQILSLDGKNIASLDEVVPYNQSLLLKLCITQG